MMSLVGSTHSGLLGAPSPHDDGAAIETGAEQPGAVREDDADGRDSSPLGVVRSAPRGVADRRRTDFGTFAVLLDLAQRGARRDLDLLLETMRPCVLTLLLRSVSEARAEELTQDVLFRVSRRYHVIRPAHAGPYLLTIVRNVLRTALRRDSARRAVVMVLTDSGKLPGLATDAGLGSLLEIHEMESAMAAACDALPSAGLRAVANAVLIECREQDDVASQFGITLTTLRKRLSRAREHLRQDARLILLIADARGQKGKERLGHSAAACDGIHTTVVRGFQGSTESSEEVSR
jgi:RNA polymerase sigma factor (sigma-70 family)